MRSSVKAVTLAPTTNTAAIAALQTPGGAGNLTLVAGVAAGNLDTNDNVRQVTITSGGSAETGKNFTISGRLVPGGNVVTEVLAGPGAGATVASVNFFYSVTNVAVSAATAGQVSVGINAVGASQPYRIDYHKNYINVALALVVSAAGSPNYTAQVTYDDVNDPDAIPLWWNHATIAAKTANTEGSQLVPITAIRLKANSGTGTGTLTILQSGTI